MRTVFILAGFITILAPIASAQSERTAPAGWNRRWVAPMQGSPAQRGAALFNNWCGDCHGKDPKSAAGTRSLEFKYQGKVPSALEDRTDLTALLVKTIVRKGIATMPFYRKTELNDSDLDALAAYLVKK